MGTKLEYAANLLASSQKSTSFSVHFVDKGLNHSFQITGLDKYHSFMINNKMPEKHNIDFIRKTMQIHEDIFKHQVRELHRLYSVQKMLMDEMKKNNNKYWREDQSPRETSGSCSGETMRIMTPRGFDLERPVVNVVPEEDLSTGVSRIDEGSSNPHQLSFEDTEIELTLSIGGSFKNKELQTQEIIFSECSAPTTHVTSSNATFDQERKNPHWLFQGLSIKRTS